MIPKNIRIILPKTLPKNIKISKVKGKIAAATNITNNKIKKLLMTKTTSHIKNLKYYFNTNLIWLS